MIRGFSPELTGRHNKGRPQRALLPVCNQHLPRYVASHDAVFICRLRAHRLSRRRPCLSISGSVSESGAIEKNKLDWALSDICYTCVQAVESRHFSVLPGPKEARRCPERALCSNQGGKNVCPCSEGGYGEQLMGQPEWGKSRRRRISVGQSVWEEIF